MEFVITPHFYSCRFWSLLPAYHRDDYHWRVRFLFWLDLFDEVKKFMARYTDTWAL